MHLNTEFKPAKNNFLAPVPVLSPSFVFRVDIKPNKKTKAWSSITRITDGVKDCCNVGNRIPMIKFRPNSYSLHISFAINGNGNKNFNSAPLKEGEYSTVVIKQTFMYGNKYRYSIRINGEEVFQTTNTKAQEFKNVKLYAGDEYYTPADCFIKNLKLNNIACKKKPFVNNNLSKHMMLF